MPTPSLERRAWVPARSEDLVQSIAAGLAERPSGVSDRVEALITANRRIHDEQCCNLNPATNTMSPRAEAALAAGLGTRPSLGYPGAKYETGLEAIEEIEIVTAEMAARVFGADYAEVRIPSGAMANLAGFLVCCRPGDRIIAPPATIAGHVTHHRPGVAGLLGLEISEAPVDAERYTVDVDALAELAGRVSPRLITLGASLNLTHHDVAGVRAVADEVGAKVLFDAAHLSGPIAGGRWPNPLLLGADLMTMSTYKSLAGPPSGMVVTNDAGIAERLDAIAFPGLTANFDAGKTAALAITLAEWLAVGSDHATAMVDSAAVLASALDAAGVPVVRTPGGFTESHALAIDASGLGGGTTLAAHLRRANLLTSAIGLPSGTDDGLRVGVNELVRWGAGPDDMAETAELVAAAIRTDHPEELAPRVTEFRRRFGSISFTL